MFTSMADDKHNRRQRQQEVNAVASETPEFMHWSEKPISWSRADHPEVMPNPGSYALVLSATLATDRRAARFSRVLIDGGSNINILYKDTMEKLGSSKDSFRTVGLCFIALFLAFPAHQSARS